MKGTTATVPYIDLPMGEDVILFPEDSEDHFPIDMSNQNLRQYSPFILEVVPPKINMADGSQHEQNKFLKSRNASLPFSSPLNQANNPLPRSRTGLSDFTPQLSSLAGSPINASSKSRSRSNLGNTIEAVSPAYTDTDNLIDYAIQYRALDTLPPIVFMINPSSFEVSYNAIQSYQDQTRYGFVFQRWGEELPTISISCSIGAFIAGYKGNKGPNGLTHTARKDSASFRHLMAIFSVYRNSAAIADRIGRSRAYQAVGRQAIHYDGQTWEGRIESMSYTLEESRQNGGISFDLSFTVYNHKFNDPMEAIFVKRLMDLNSSEEVR